MTATNIIPLDMPEPKRFVPPSLEEVKLHAAKIGLPMREAEKFWCFYDSKDWHVGKNKMKRWHSSMALWKLNWGGATTTQATTGYSVPQSAAIAYAKSLGDKDGYVINWLSIRGDKGFFGITQSNWKQVFADDLQRFREKQTNRR